MQQVNSALLASVVGALTMMGLQLIPGLDGWYLAKDDKERRVVHIILGAVVSVVLFALNCVGISHPLLPVVQCSQAGIIDLVVVFVTFLIGLAGGNQAVVPTRAGWARAAARSPMQVYESAKLERVEITGEQDKE